MKAFLFALAAASLLPTAATAGDLAEQLAARKARLAELTTQITNATGADFNADHDLQAFLKTELLQRWADAVMVPNYTISAQGTKVESELVYKPGRYKIWLEPAQDVKFRATFSPFRFTSGADRISIASNLGLHAEARIFFDAYGVRGNVFCDSDPATIPVAASVTLQPLTGDELPYSMTLRQPASVNVPVTCHLGPIGSYTQSFPMDNIARDLGHGRLKVGYTSTIELFVPGLPQPLKIALATKNTAATVDVAGIDVRTDVDIVHGLEVARAQLSRTGILVPQ